MDEIECDVDMMQFPRVRIIEGRIYVTMIPSGGEQGLELTEWQRLHALLGIALRDVAPPLPATREDGA